MLKRFFKIMQHLLQRLAGILFTIALGIFLVVILMNQSGFIDEAILKEARNEARIFLSNNPSKDIFATSTEREAYINEQAKFIAAEAGVNLPFWARHLRWTWNMLTFQWGDVKGIKVTDAGAIPTFSVAEGPSALRHRALNIISHLFPDTLKIIGVAYFIVFSLGLPLALKLSLRYNSWADRLMSGLAPLSAVPSWVYGILLVSIFAIELNWLPFGGKYDTIITENKTEVTLMVLRHMILPVTAVVLSMFFQLVYTWRTYFLLYSQEDYVELAVAMGLPARTLQTQYIFRPSLSYVLTTFMFTLSGFWQMTTALEYFFGWPGIGSMYIRSLLLDDLLVTLGVVVIFAYLLGGIVFFLDIAYIIVDPRIRFNIINPPQQRGHLVQQKGRKRFVFPKIKFELPRFNLKQWVKSFREWYVWSAKPFFAQLRQYPLSILSMLFIFGLVCLSLAVPFLYPYESLHQLWQRDYSPYKTRPELARPVWFNWFLQKDLPENIYMDSRIDPSLKNTINNEESATHQFVFELSVPDGDFPQEVMLYLHTQNVEKQPFMTLTWVTPDQREFALKNATVQNGFIYNLNDNIPIKYLDNRYRRLSFYMGGTGEPPYKVLFADPFQEDIKPYAGTYLCIVNIITFDPQAQVDIEFLLMGKTYGWAGTDHLRRDLSVGLLWGLPVALSIGLLGAVTTSLLAMFIAALATWYGGFVDATVQRLTEINMMIPVLAVGVMLATYYDFSIWMVLLIAILLNAFGSSTRTYRAAFLQVKVSPYIEAAISYGASDLRIITSYMLPRVLPIVIPQVVMLIPGYVFLEATLAIFEVSSTYIPTWGSIIYDAVTNRAMRGEYYWMLEPIFALLAISLIFAVFGFSLDRILNPRLRSS